MAQYEVTAMTPGEAMKELVREMGGNSRIACDLICDTITAEGVPPVKGAELKALVMATLLHPRAGYFDSIVSAARATFNDPTESGHAAHIRDALRDNFTLEELGIR